MSDFFKTNLVLVLSPIPADFEGTPQELADALVERLEIQSPVGTNFFVVGDIEPSTDQGPWLKNGTQWYVFSPAAGRYIPLDISASTARLFTAGATEPAAPEEGEALIWLRTATGRAIGWYFWTGAEWRPDGNVFPRGATSARPTDPVEGETFFDTSINAAIIWERSAWRTLSGVPGDVKSVVTPTLTEALTNNPGWRYLGDLDANFIGRVIGVASKDQITPAAPIPVSNFATGSGITPRESGEVDGAETHVLTSTEIEQHTHLVGALVNLNSNNKIQFYRVDDGQNFSAPSPRPPNYAESAANGTNGTKTGELNATNDGTMLVTSRQLSLTNAAAYTGAATAHNNVQPTLFLWHLTKL